MPNTYEVSQSQNHTSDHIFPETVLVTPCVTHHPIHHRRVRATPSLTCSGHSVTRPPEVTLCIPASGTAGHPIIARSADARARLMARLSTSRRAAAASRLARTPLVCTERHRVIWAVIYAATRNNCRSTEWPYGADAAVVSV